MVQGISHAPALANSFNQTQSNESGERLFYSNPWDRTIETLIDFRHAQSFAAF